MGKKLSLQATGSGYKLDTKSKRDKYINKFEPQHQQNIWIFFSKNVKLCFTKQNNQVSGIVKRESRLWKEF